eukprot:12548307-Alexandrium_andersonii.AAC.1
MCTVRGLALGGVRRRDGERGLRALGAMGEATASAEDTPAPAVTNIGAAPGIVGKPSPVLALLHN